MAIRFRVEVEDDGNLVPRHACDGLWETAAQAVAFCEGVLAVVVPLGISRWRFSHPEYVDSGVAYQTDVIPGWAGEGTVTSFFELCPISETDSGWRVLLHAIPVEVPDDAL